MADESDDVKNTAAEALFQSKENAKQLAELTSLVNTSVKSFNDKLDKQDSKLDAITREIRSEVRASQPSNQSYAMWAGVILTVVYFLWGKESAAIDKHFEQQERRIEQVSEAPSRVMKEYQSRLERIENWQDEQSREKIRRYDDLVDKTLNNSKE